MYRRIFSSLLGRGASLTEPAQEFCITRQEADFREYSRAQAVSDAGLVSSRGTSLGVRGVLFDRNGRVLLVRRKGVGGWYLPGGSVRTDETVVAALAWHIEEEVALPLAAVPVLHGLFHHHRKKTHVACYSIILTPENNSPHPGRGIEEVAFFPHDALPSLISGSARARIEEVSTDSPPPLQW